MTASWWTNFQRYLLALLAPLFGITLVAAVHTGATTVADAAAGTDCSSVLVAHSTVAGHSVGETGCSVTATSTFTDATGRAWNREDLAISGTAAGWADPVTVGNTRKDLTDVPNVLFPQFGIPSWTAGVGSYAGGPDGQGAGISVLYPSTPAAWNGRAVLLVHGQANNTALGAIVAQTPGQPLPEQTFNNLYADEWIDAGYAVIYTRRPASSGVPTTMDTGAKLDESINDNVHVLRDFLTSGENLLAQKLGHAPSSVLYYGHSAGVIVGRLWNYSGLNDTAAGGHYLAGFLSDDPGGGLPLPLSMPAGQVLGVRDGQASYPASALLPAAARAQMVPELTFAHGLYLDQHSWLPGVLYLTLKQQAQAIYRDEGLADQNNPARDRADLEVVAGVSHIPDSTGSPANTLDMGTLIQAAIPALADWVDHGTPPPAAITGAVGDTSAAHEVQLPSIACPTGVHYPWPAPDGGPTETGFAAFDGRSLEPVDSRGALVDVNGDGVRDAMPSVTAVWRQLKLLAPNQPLTSTAYLACVQRDVTDLVHRRLLTQAAADAYLAQARGSSPF